MMPKTSLHLRTDDLSGFVRALAKQLGDASPSHLSLMNMIARSVGYQNVQHMRSAQAAQHRLDRAQLSDPADPRTIERALHQFDASGRLQRWPSRRGVQTLALWALWATLPAAKQMEEREVNARLNDEHIFEDPATLRRMMISCGLLTRRKDGSDYRRIEQAPSADAKALIKTLRARRRTRAPDVSKTHPEVQKDGLGRGPTDAAV